MRAEVYYCDRCAEQSKRRVADFRVFPLDADGATAENQSVHDACAQHLPIVVRKGLVAPNVTGVTVRRVDPPVPPARRAKA